LQRTLKGNANDSHNKALITLTSLQKKTPQKNHKFKDRKHKTQLCIALFVLLLCIIILVTVLSVCQPIISHVCQSLMNQSQSAIPMVQGNAQNRNSFEYCSMQITFGNTKLFVKAILSTFYNVMPQ
jgi:hypothetical protein